MSRSLNSQKGKRMAHTIRGSQEELSLRKRQLLDNLRENLTATTKRIAPRDKDLLHLPLSFAQQRLWFFDQLAPGQPFYNVVLAERLCGQLRLDVLKESLATIIARHEALRTSFRVVGDQPMQIIASTLELPLTLIDVQDTPEAEREQVAMQFANREARTPFDLTTGPLLRFLLLRLHEQEHLLVITMHHIISDGWSIGVFLHELITLYSCALAARPPRLPALPIQYADFALWQRQWLQGEVLEEQLGYWRARLTDLPTLHLPTDHPRPAVQSFQGALELFRFPLALREGLLALSRRAGVTLFVTLLAGFQALLSRYSRQEDIVVGSAIANRNRSEIEGLIGFFVNTLLLRTDLSGDPTVLDLLGRVQEVCLGAYSHQDLPFERLVEEVQPERDLSRQPLFQAMFVFQNSPTPRLELPDLTFYPIALDHKVAKFDLALSLEENDNMLGGMVEYSTDLFEQRTIQRFLLLYQRLLQAMAEAPGQHLSQLSLLDAAERHSLLSTWNATASLYPQQHSLSQLFEQQVACDPNAVALRCGEEALSYQQLNEQANQLARLLIEQGVGTETRVGIALERTPGLIVGLLAILKAGGTYVPLDPTYPQPRLQVLCEQAQVNVLLSQRTFAQRFPFVETIILLDEEQGRLQQRASSNLHRPILPQQLAYIMYTSGSTGQPKGVMVTQRNVVRLVKGTSYACFDPQEIFLHISPLSFDASTFEIWGALLNGACLVLCPQQRSSLEELLAVIEQYQVSTLLLTTALLHQVVERYVQRLQGVRQLLTGGDVLSVSHAQSVVRNLPGCRMINGYGPTEGTTYTTCYQLEDAEEVETSVPIGRPLANTRVYVLDASGSPVPIGMAGELYVGGDGVARGYLGDVALTAQRFLPDPFSQQPGQRLYKTGDLVRYRPDGTIEFMGRIDQQMKIRGFRIEPGEIEVVLRQHPLIRDVLVMSREDTPGEKRLVAYVIFDEEYELNSSEMRSYLQQHLPEYMIPTAFVRLDQFPLTPSGGKINRQMLPAPDNSRPELDGIFAAPRTAAEAIVVDIFAQILEVEQVGVYDNFFELGGDSLLATRVVTQVRDLFQVDLPLRNFFSSPTVATLTEVIVNLLKDQLGDDMLLKLTAEI